MNERINKPPLFQKKFVLYFMTGQLLLIDGKSYKETKCFYTQNTHKGMEVEFEGRI